MTYVLLVVVLLPGIFLSRPDFSLFGTDFRYGIPYLFMTASFLSLCVHVYLYESTHSNTYL
jgi:hypothetical protein